MARQLEAAGLHVRQVLVLDTPAPEPEAGSVDELGLLLWFLEDLDVGFHAERDGPSLKLALSALPSEERLPRALDLTPAARAAAGDLAPVFAVFRSVVTACRGYRPRPIAADIVLLRAAEGCVSEFTGHPAGARPDWGWAELTRGRARAMTVPGSHHTLLAEPQVGAVATALRSLLH
jgi:thioesterase domain-containing protein